MCSTFIFRNFEKFEKIPQGPGITPPGGIHALITPGPRNNPTGGFVVGVAGGAGGTARRGAEHHKHVTRASKEHPKSTKRTSKSTKRAPQEHQKNIQVHQKNIPRAQTEHPRAQKYYPRSIQEHKSTKRASKSIKRTPQEQTKSSQEYNSETERHIHLCKKMWIRGLGEDM